MGDRIRISAINPRYFQWGGEIVYPLGVTESGADTCGGQNGWLAISSGFDWQPDLERMLASGGNYTRVIPYFPNHPVMPWVQLEDERYDLAQINPEWVTRLQAYLDWTEAQGIVVQLEVFENFSLKDAPWLANPLNPDRNVNYDADVIAEVSRRADIALYRAVTENKEAVLSLLMKYVSTLVLTTAPYGNVLYNISNESNAPLEWAEYWANYVRRLAASRGYDVLIGEMPHGFEPTTGVDAIADSREFDFVDASSYTSEDQFGENNVPAILAGGDEILTGLAVRSAKPVTIGKIYFRSPLTLWSKFMNGTASARFHRNCDRGGSDEENPERYFDYIRNLRTFIDELDLEAVDSLDDSLAQVTAEEIQVDVLAATARWYAVHLANLDGSAEPFEMELDLPEGRYTARWYEPATGTWTPVEIRGTAAGPRGFQVPEFTSSIALLVERVDD